jgi:flagellin
MPQIINTNIASLNAQRNLNRTGNDLQTSLQRLSTGLRINSARDDAAGLAISERFTTQIRGLNQAVRNANDGISFAQTAEGALSTVGDSLQRMRELAVQAINDTNSSSDRQALNNEVGQLIAEVTRIANSTQFNGQNVLDGTLSDLTFQVGANQGQTITVSGVDSRASQLGARVATTGSLTATQIAAGSNDLVVNGNTIDISAATTSQDIVNAVNALTSSHGITAIKATSVDTGALAVTTGTVTINGVSVALDGTDAASVSASADSINALTNQTGVTATASGTDITLTNTDGSDIVITGAFLGGTAETYSAGITFAGAVSDGAFTITGGTTTDVSGALLGAAVQADQALTTANVLTGTDANDALLTLDFALNQVSGLRAELGAVQTRFESTITNLSVTSENLSAARSRIRDADFAAETAELTRTQILQQAGISILAQANVLPQSALALLQ